MRSTTTFLSLSLALFALGLGSLRAQSCPTQNAAQCLGVEALDQGGLKIAIEVTAQSAMTVTGFSIPCYRRYGPYPSLPTYILRGTAGAGPTLNAAPAATGSMDIQYGTQSAPWTSTTFPSGVQVAAGETFFLSFLLPAPAFNTAGTGIRMPIAAAPACSGPLLSTPGYTLDTLQIPLFQSWYRFPYVTSHWMFQVACSITPVGVAPSITSQPQSQTVAAGSMATFSVGASGTAPLGFQWRKNGVDIGGANLSTYSVIATAALNGSGYSVFVSNAYGSAASQSAFLTVNSSPVITSQPQNVWACMGTPVTLSVAATSTTPLTYQWQSSQGVNVSGATSPNFTVNATTGPAFLSFRCLVSNAYGSAWSAWGSAAGTNLPVITLQPLSQAVCLGSPVSFSITAGASGGVTLQWRKNGVAIAGASSGIYSIAAVTAASAGNYDVQVSNSCGMVTSNLATLTASTVPVITFQPQSVTVCAGSLVTMSVAATGGPLAYQWKKSNVAIVGASSASFSIPAATPVDAGSYTVVVSNSCGSATSAAAILTVNQPVCDFTFNVPAGGCLPVIVTFQDISTTTVGSIVTRNWDFNGEGTASGSTVSHTFTTAGTKAVTLVVTTSFGCSATRTKSVVTGVLPVVSAVTASTQCGAAPLLVVFSATATPAATSWNWDFNNDGIIDSTAANPTFTYTQPGVYTVTVSATSCSSTSAPITMPAFIEVRSSVPAALLEYQFNEVDPNAVLVANSAYSCGGPAPEFATVSQAGWQADPGAGRARFKSQDPSAGNTGCFGRSGVDRAVSTGWNVSLPPSFTFMWWQRMGPVGPSSQSVDRVYVFEADNNFYCAAGGAAGSGLQVRFGSGGGGQSSLISSSIQSNPGVWMHVAVVRSAAAGSTQFFLDGIPDPGQAGAGTGAVATSTDLVIGNRHDGTGWAFSRYFDLDDFRVYPSAFSQAQIQTAMLGENAAATRFGTATQGAGLAPRIGANGAPAIGNSLFTVRLENAEPGVPCVLAFGFSARSTGGIPLPLALSPGFPGSSLYIDPEYQLFLNTGNGTLDLNIPITAPSLQGVHAYAQFAILGSTFKLTEGLDLNIQ